MPLFCSSGERAILLVFVHWHAEVLLREGRFMAEFQAGYASMFCFLLSRQLYFAASDTKETKDSTLFHYTERQIPDWTARTCRSHGKDDNLVGTFLYRLADIAEICTEQTKSFPQKYHLHSSATLHSSTALCWFVPGTHVSSPQFRNSLPTATISLSLQSLWFLS